MPPRYIAVPFLAGGSTPLPITTPVLTATTISSTQINLSLAYSPPPSSGSFAFEQAPSANGPWTPISSQGSPNYSVTGLSQNTLYFFRGRVQVVDGRFSDYSNTAQANTLASAPAQVQGLAVTGVTSSTVSLSWSSASLATSYNVYRSGTKVAQGISGTTYTDSGLSQGTTYQYTVSGSNSAGEGSQSSSVSGTTTIVSNNVYKFQPGIYECLGFGKSSKTDIMTMIDAVSGTSMKGVQVDTAIFAYNRATGSALVNSAGDTTRNWGKPFVQDVLDYAASKGVYVMWGFEDRTFDSAKITTPPSGKYPQSWIDNGWVFVPGTAPPQSILTLWVSAAMSAYLAMCQDFLQTFNSHPALVMFCPFGETAISNGPSSSQRATYWNGCVSGFQTLTQYAPNTPLRWQANNIDGDFFAEYATLVSVPGMFIGGPDPEGPGPLASQDTRKIQAWYNFRGVNASGASAGPDYRGRMGFVAEFQAYNATTTPNQQSLWQLQQNLPQTNQYFVLGESSGAAQFSRANNIAFANSVNGLTNPNPPSNGNYGT